MVTVHGLNLRVVYPVTRLSYLLTKISRAILVSMANSE